MRKDGEGKSDAELEALQKEAEAVHRLKKSKKKGCYERG